MREGYDEMTDEEYFDYKEVIFSLFFTPVFLPAVVLAFTLFGYVNWQISIVQIVFLCINLIGFTRRMWFLNKHKRFISKKQLIFQTISYLCLIAFSIACGCIRNEVAVDGSILLGNYPTNFIAQGIAILYSFVVLVFMIKNAKEIANLVNSKSDENALCEDTIDAENITE